MCLQGHKSESVFHLLYQIGYLLYIYYQYLVCHWQLKEVQIDRKLNAESARNIIDKDADFSRIYEID